MDGSYRNALVSCAIFIPCSLLFRALLLGELRFKYVVLELGAGLLIAGTTGFSLMVRRELTKSTLEVKASRNFKDVAVSLLLKTCDAVVQLSEDFRVADPAPNLSALLLRQSSMEGLPFTDLILKPDALTRFLNFMAGASDANDELLLPLRDSAGSAVNVRVMHAKALDDHDKVFHILGIQEISTAHSDATPQAHAQLKSSSKSLREVDCMSDASSSSSMQSLDESRPVLSGTVPVDFKEDDESALLELDDNFIKFVGCSAALISLLGPIDTNCDLFEKLSPIDPQAFISWVRNCLSVGHFKVRSWFFRCPRTDRKLRAIVLLDPNARGIQTYDQDQDCTAGVLEKTRSEGVRFRLQLLEVRFSKTEKRKGKSASSKYSRKQPQQIARPGLEAEEQDGQPNEVEEILSTSLPNLIGRDLAETRSHSGSPCPSETASDRRIVASI